MAEEMKKTGEEETKICKNCGEPILPRSYGWVHKKSLINQCHIYAEPEEGSLKAFLRLNPVDRKMLVDGKTYIFKNGGVWRMGMFDKQSNMILSGEMELPGVDNNTLFEVPEE